MVQKPEYAEMYDWDGFLKLCRQEGIQTDDWEEMEPWWVFWKGGFDSATNY